MFREHLMKADKTSSDSDLSSIPAEFRENYRFLSELINCKQQNTSITRNLEQMVRNPICSIRARLNRRQRQILGRLLREFRYDENEPFAPPVPPELEASLRLRKPSTWLPWEAEAIHKDRTMACRHFLNSRPVGQQPLPIDSTHRIGRPGRALAQISTT